MQSQRKLLSVSMKSHGKTNLPALVADLTLLGLEQCVLIEGLRHV